jgi:hypothetical protein
MTAQQFKSPILPARPLTLPAIHVRAVLTKPMKKGDVPKQLNLRNLPTGGAG